ncbi:GntR family transcriptional regulator [Limosilactobacillus sp. STM2_1]|uniref:GntR family transcriptional regulator n=1 Tax=Limosilactobacillus rudii TaxID=2759755 RepID=A0A7W3YMP2_9LACO|nr:GntR family transcriptional regulator [Limosilactobacillus rudii]MBB1078784.1 GntR family transcriptional regulator [Limosilactobacillus rudii]MBB1097664.1 GntR family transcriptional regulator [Limosilactobacillus rudii]MCD7134773.1 GntR family transcriptional regulator [Limosilactobacillus rudii]
MYLDRNSNLRAQIVSAIQNDIFTNRKVGDKLPSEAEYAEMFNVTRSTVQKALKDLEQMNLIEKVQGKGSFVHQTKPHVKLFNFKGFTDYAHQIGAIAVNKIVSTEIVKENGRSLYKLRRLRLIKTDQKLTPMTLDESIIDLQKFPKLDQYDFSKQSLYEVIRQEYKVYPSTSLLRMSAISANKEEAQMLDCNEHSALLQAEGIVHDQSGEVVERVKVIYSHYAEFDLTLGM